MIICVIGASGSGKTSIVNEAMKILDYGKIITSTTRSPRVNEKDGIDYHFIDKEKIMKSDFVEYDEYRENLYGTRYSDIMMATKNHENAFEIVTWNGYKNISKKFDAVPVIVENRNFNELKRRMIGRGDSAESIEKRMEGIREESDFLHNIKDAYHYDNSGLFDPGRFSKKINKIVSLNRQIIFTNSCKIISPNKDKLIDVLEQCKYKADISLASRFCQKHNDDRLCNNVYCSLMKDIHQLKNHDIEFEK